MPHAVIVVVHHADFIFRMTARVFWDNKGNESAAVPYGIFTKRLEIPGHASPSDHVCAV